MNTVKVVRRKNCEIR